MYKITVTRWNRWKRMDKIWTLLVTVLKISFEHVKIFWSVFLTPNKKEGCCKLNECMYVSVYLCVCASEYMCGRLWHCSSQKNVPILLEFFFVWKRILLGWFVAMCHRNLMVSKVRAMFIYFMKHQILVNEPVFVPFPRSASDRYKNRQKHLITEIFNLNWALKIVF